MSTNWADFGIDLSVTNLSKEELEYYNSGGTVDADQYGRRTFPRKRDKWISKVEWTADIEPLPPFDPADFIQLIECDKQQK
jgi:hypothetical protein